MTGSELSRQIAPRDAWIASQHGETRILDLRSYAERAALGYPPGSKKVSMLFHWIRPDRAAIYLCQHAVRSKVPLRRGGREVAGGFKAWSEAGLPVTSGLPAGRGHHERKDGEAR